MIPEPIKEYEEDKKKYEKVMNEINSKISEMTEENVMEVSNFMKNVEHALTSEKESKHIFKQKLEELNMFWNKETMQYEKKVEEVKKDESKEISNNTEPTQ